MCLARAYLITKDKKELLMEQIASLKAEGNRVLVTTLFGEQKEIQASIKEIDFRGSSITLER